MHFNRYNVITQFPKLAAAEQLYCRCTHTNYSTSYIFKVSLQKKKNYL